MLRIYSSSILLICSSSLCDVVDIWVYVRTIFQVLSSSSLLQVYFPGVTSALSLRFNFFLWISFFGKNITKQLKQRGIFFLRWSNFTFFSKNHEIKTFFWNVWFNLLILLSNRSVLSEVSAPSFSRLIENYSKRNWRNYSSDWFYHAINPILGTTILGSVYFQS